MAVVIPSAWRTVTLDEIRSRELIVDGGPKELARHLTQHNRCMASDVPINLALLDCRNKGIEDALTVGSFRRVALGRVRLWSLEATLEGFFQGKEVELRYTIGGSLVLTGSVGGVFGWSSTNAGQPTGAATSPDFLVTVLVEAKLTDAGGQLWRVALTERAVKVSDLPSVFNPDTAVVSLDSEAIQPDQPYDSYLVQQMTLNARAIQWERSRRHLHWYPATTNVRNRRHALSSAFWRLDGPYVVTGQPWCDVALVDLTVENDGAFFQGVEVFAFSELETFEDARANAQTVPLGVQSFLTFEVPIRSDIESTTLIWVAFKSIIDSVTRDTVDIVEAPPEAPDLLYCDDSTFFYTQQNNVQYAAFGVVGFTTSDTTAADFDPAVKNALPYDAPSTFFDIATIVGTDPTLGVGTPGRMRLRMSPHRGTSYMDGARFQSIGDVAGGVIIYNPSMDVKFCGVLYLYGVYIEVRPSLEPVFDRMAKPGTPPRASTWRRINNPTNAQINFGSSQLISRHPGQFQITNTLNPGAATIYLAGKYLYATSKSSGSSPAQIDHWIVLIQDPNLGASSDQLVDRIYVKVWLMVLHNSGTQTDEEAEVTFQLLGPPAGDIVSTFFPVLTGRPVAGQQPTEGDAGVGATADATWVDPGTFQPASPQNTVANANTQEYTWPRQGQTLELPWMEGPTLFCDLPSITFPGEIRVEIRTGDIGSNRDVSLVVAGMSAWCGPRI